LLTVLILRLYVMFMGCFFLYFLIFAPTSHEQVRRARMRRRGANFWYNVFEANTQQDHNEKQKRDPWVVYTETTRKGLPETTGAEDVDSE